MFSRVGETLIVCPRTVAVHEIRRNIKPVGLKHMLSLSAL